MRYLKIGKFIAPLKSLKIAEILDMKHPRHVPSNDICLVEIAVSHLGPFLNKFWSKKISYNSASKNN